MKYKNLPFQVVDPVKDYVELMKTIVDFTQIKTFLAETNFKLLINSLHGATGPYVEAIFRYDDDNDDDDEDDDLQGRAWLRCRLLHQDQRAD